MIEIGWTDKAVQAEIGERFKQLRLEKNRTLEVLAYRTMISINTLKALEQGRAKLETMIAVLRDLDALEELNNFIAPVEFSPIQYMKMRGKKRIRASSPRKKKEIRPESTKAFYGGGIINIDDIPEPGRTELSNYIDAHLFLMKKGVGRMQQTEALTREQLETRVPVKGDFINSSDIPEPY